MNLKQRERESDDGWDHVEEDLCVVLSIFGTAQHSTKGFNYGCVKNFLTVT